jgi:hypothetical protein
VHRDAVILFVAKFNILLSQNADALGLGAAATVRDDGPALRGPRGSCKQHFCAGKMNLIVDLLN